MPVPWFLLVDNIAESFLKIQEEVSDIAMSPKKIPCKGKFATYLFG